MLKKYVYIYAVGAIIHERVLCTQLARGFLFAGRWKNKIIWIITIDRILHNNSRSHACYIIIIINKIEPVAELPIKRTIYYSIY